MPIYPDPGAVRVLLSGLPTTMSILRALQCSPTTVTNRIRRGVDRPLRESLVKTATIPVELPCTDESRARINSVGRQRASGGTPRQLSATEVEVLMSKSDYMEMIPA